MVGCAFILQASSGKASLMNLTFEQKLEGYGGGGCVVRVKCIPGRWIIK